MSSDTQVTTGFHSRRASPLLAAPILGEHDSNTLSFSSRYSVQAGEPVLTGHFPGLAIFPGVCLIECAHLSVLSALEQAVDGREALRLAGIESARFLAPVFPGDEVQTDISARRADTGDWVCSAVTSVRGTQTGVFRLRYRAEPADQGEGRGA